MAEKADAFTISADRPTNSQTTAKIFTYWQR